ncbi:phage tail assembly protein [Pseudomonas aeruginosa]|uniref:phage tail assembly protein n=1 Tax=Pseudomonas aeruginosa TaxID=287 RepID=UPI000D3CBBF6|nr:phage tail assembly protein [Pseudomonas aeruginosa]PTZ12173.1 phage tail assembly protein [Pseudomonas aeruginosa]
MSTPPVIRLLFPFTSASGERIEELTIRRLKRRDLADAQRHSKDEAVIEDHLLCKMTGLTLEDLETLDLADSRTVTEVFRELVAGRDGTAVLGRSAAPGATDAAE